MKWSSFKYLAKQGWHSMVSNRLMTLASIGVLSACLFITGVAALLSVNVNSFVAYLSAQNEVEIYLNDIDEGAAETLRAQVAAIDNVTECLYISKAEAVEQMKVQMGDDADLLTAYEGQGNSQNPLPASLRAKITKLELLNDTVAQITAVCGENTYKIQVPSDLSAILVSLKRVVTYVGWGLVLVLSIVSIVVISNTIRLTVFSRRKEINIMKFVGATNAFIRLPFFVEGMTVGAIAGIISTALVGGGYYALLYYAQQPEAAWLADFTRCLLPMRTVLPWLAGGFVLFGIFIGGLGCITSIRKHLKV
ncbi:MAG: permease-like cell division protein FtsX [Ruthenibacterium sp.]